MKNGGGVWVGHWQQSIVDLLIGASTVVVVFATIAATADARDLLILGASALIAIALMFERNAAAPAADETDPQSARPPTGPIAGSRQRGDGFDTAIGDATSV
jgi:hypothetical protein